MIRDAGEEPLIIGVHGDWGAGRSSILLMLENTFDEDDRTSVIRFNGWLFQGLEDAKTVVIETIVEQLLLDHTTTTKLQDAAARLLKRVDLMKVASKAGELALTGLTGIPSPDMLGGLMDMGKKLLTDGTDMNVDDVTGFVTGVTDCLSEADADTLPAHVHAFRLEFGELLAAADIDRLVVVDDLDRCLPATAIETLEAIRLFLFVPGAAFVIAADEGMIEYAVRTHFPDLPLSTGPFDLRAEFGLAPQPHRSIRRFEDERGNYYIELLPGPFGLPTIQDQDILIYCMSMAMAEVRRGRPVPERVQMTATELLRFANRSTGGRQYDAVESAIYRLTTLTLKSNLRGEETTYIELFGIVDRVAIGHLAFACAVYSTEDGANWEKESIDKGDLLGLEVGDGGGFENDAYQFGFDPQEGNAFVDYLRMLAMEADSPEFVSPDDIAPGDDNLPVYKVC